MSTTFPLAVSLPSASKRALLVTSLQPSCRHTIAAAVPYQLAAAGLSLDPGVTGTCR